MRVVAKNAQSTLRLRKRATRSQFDSTLLAQLPRAGAQDFVDLKRTLQRAATAARCVRGMFGNKLYSHSILAGMQSDSMHSIERTISLAIAPLLHRAPARPQQTP